MNNNYVTGIIVLVLLLVVFGPLALIWSLNTLFPVLTIPYTLETWFATLMLNSMVFAGRRNSK